MAATRIRSIKPEVLEDEVALDLSDTAWRLWVSMWLLADDHGRLRGSGRALAAGAWQDTARRPAALKARAELERAGLITVYVVRGEEYVEIKPEGWARHQRIDHPGKPRVPGPDEATPLLAAHNDNAELPAFQSETLGRHTETLGDTSEAHRGSRDISPSRTRAPARAGRDPSPSPSEISDPFFVDPDLPDRLGSRARDAKRKPKRAKSSAPASDAPPEVVRAWLVGWGIPLLDDSAEGADVAAMLDHARQGGLTFVDWGARWRTWRSRRFVGGPNGARASPQPSWRLQKPAAPGQHVWTKPEPIR